ncbi:unnamed protein product [Caenorhabditis auriculariae]|uniref:MAGE domain-containing protein n=1 Tax=Caenorhabditis auriculariae TaxID=2777116 RepID=A0A8S1HP77_9PELO|nr:unnamed protein product [Caenorhabditis auriculariae]
MEHGAYAICFKTKKCEKIERKTFRPRQEHLLTTELTHFFISSISKNGYAKEADLRKIYTTADHSYHGQLPFKKYNVIFARVEKRLSLLKWELKRVDEKIYVINKLKQASKLNMPIKQKEYHDAILAAALMYIFAARNPEIETERGVSADDLYEFLFEILRENENKSLSTKEEAELKRLIAPHPRAVFIKKGYLSYFRATDPDGVEQFRFDWGSNAHTNYDPQSLMITFAKFSGEPSTTLSQQANKSIELKQLQLLKPISGKNRAKLVKKEEK